MIMEVRGYERVEDEFIKIKELSEQRVQCTRNLIYINIKITKNHECCVQESDYNLKELKSM
jgi:hypothetical protein